MGPEDIDLTWAKESYVDSIAQDYYTAFLKQGLWHTTTILGICGILKENCILANDGRFPFTYPQTARSYGHLKKYICLFDFESASEEEVILQHDAWIAFFCHDPCTIAIKLNRASIGVKIIPSATAMEEVGYSRCWIPSVEVWSPEPLPLSQVIEFYVIPRFQRNAIKCGSTDELVETLSALLPFSRKAE